MTAAAVFALAGVVAVVGSTQAKNDLQGRTLLGLALWTWVIAGLVGAGVLG